MNALAEVIVIEQALARLRALLTPATEDVLLHFSQNDSRWKNEIYSGGQTFGQAGCLVTCVAMIAAQAQPELTPTQVALALRNAGAFVGALLSRPARIPTAFPWLSWEGAMHWRMVPAQITELAAMLAAHGPTILEVKWDPKDKTPPDKGNQHFVVATAITAALDDVTVVDPWDGEEKSLLTSRYALPMKWRIETAIQGVRRLWPV
jgi:hypothetical protein